MLWLEHMSGGVELTLKRCADKASRGQNQFRGSFTVNWSGPSGSECDIAAPPIPIGLVT